MALERVVVAQVGIAQQRRVRYLVVVGGVGVNERRRVWRHRDQLDPEREVQCPLLVQRRHRRARDAVQGSGVRYVQRQLAAFGGARHERDVIAELAGRRVVRDTGVRVGEIERFPDQLAELLG